MYGIEYLMASECRRTNDGDNYYTIVYRMDSLTRASQIAVLENISITPRTPRKGEIVTVSLNDAVQTEGVEGMTFTAANGNFIFLPRPLNSTGIMKITGILITEGGYLLDMFTFRGY